MLWSSVSIPGKLRVLIVDASGDVGGWESELFARLFTSMKRRGLHLIGSAPARAKHPADMLPDLEPQDTCNTILLFSRGEGQGVPAGAGLGSYWSWLNSQSGLAPKLFAVCPWESYDPEVCRQILESPETFAPLAIAPQSPVTPRDANLYLLKFFTELHLHSDDTITGRMVWFSASKARELLRRRRLTGKFGTRC